MLKNFYNKNIHLISHLNNFEIYIYLKIYSCPFKKLLLVLSKIITDKKRYSIYILEYF